MNNIDRQYKELLEHILRFGNVKKDRTGTGTMSIFGWQIRHRMSEGFPLLTTKKMHWKSIVTELIWFLNGDTNIKYLVDNNCNIWNGDAYKRYEREVIKSHKQNGLEGFDYLKLEAFVERIKSDSDFAKQWGELGPIYGKQWRDWGGKTETNLTNERTPEGYLKYEQRHIPGIDQLGNLIKDLKKDPDSRRLMLNAWNVEQIPSMVLPPCHYGFQLYTRELSYDERAKLMDKIYGIQKPEDRVLPWHTIDIDEANVPKRAISLMWNQRSVDTFLGLPFNIASYALLLCIIAEVVNMVPEDLIGNLGDTHLYLNHLEQAQEQTKRIPYELPRLRINSEFWAPGTEDGCGMGAGTYSEDIDGLIKGFQIDDFLIENYVSHPVIKAPLSN